VARIGAIYVLMPKKPSQAKQLRWNIKNVKIILIALVGNQFGGLLVVLVVKLWILIQKNFFEQFLVRDALTPEL